MVKSLKIYSIVALLLFFSACAQVVAPTGGPKDEAAPKVLKSSPPNQTTNFSKNKISIEFDEFVQLRDLKKQLIISPPLKYDLETAIKSKSLEIKIKDTLLENTTYVINFGNAVVDIAEGNSIKDFKYTFSTGKDIDSLQQQGRVIDASSLKVEEAAFVMLYELESFNDSTPIKNLPTYISRTDANGEYTITNIKEGKYRLFVLQDANNNYLFDRPDERIAFEEKPIEITQKNKSITSYIFEEKQQKQFIESQKELFSQTSLDFKLPVKKLDYVGIDTNLKELLLHVEKNEIGDSIKFWWKEMDKKKIKLALTALPEFSDTIKIKIDSFPTKSPLKLISAFNATQAFYKPIRLKFNRPIQKIDSSKIQVMAMDSSLVPFEISVDSQFLQLSHLRFKFKDDVSYNLQLLPNAFTDIYGKGNDTLTGTFNFNKPSDLGKLLINLDSSDTSPKIIQLTNSKGTILRERTIKNENVEFEHLTPGSYGLRLIFDQNEDQEWTTGSYLSNRQAEKVVIFDEAISIRRNWDKEIKWIIK